MNFDLAFSLHSSAGTSDPMDGLQAWHPSPPAGWLSINLANWRRTHTLELRQDDGTEWTARLAPGFESATGELPVTRTSFPPPDHQYTFSHTYLYAYLQVPYDLTQGFTITDLETGETLGFPAGTQTALQLQQWGTAPELLPIHLDISATRYGHRLQLRTSFGDAFDLPTGASQGYFLSTGPFVPYYYYRVQDQFVRSGCDWWLHDLDTGTSSPPNSNDYSTWHAEDADLDADNDGLPDWYERFLTKTSTDPTLRPDGTRAVGWDHDGDGLSDAEEVLLGSDPKTAAVRDPARLTLTIFTPIQ